MSRKNGLSGLLHWISILPSGMLKYYPTLGQQILWHERKSQMTRHRRVLSLNRAKSVSRLSGEVTTGSERRANSEKRSLQKENGPIGWESGRRADRRRRRVERQCLRDIKRPSYEWRLCLLQRDPPNQIRLDDPQNCQDNYYSDFKPRGKIHGRYSHGHSKCTPVIPSATLLCGLACDTYRVWPFQLT